MNIGLSNPVLCEGNKILQVSKIERGTLGSISPIFIVNVSAFLISTGAPLSQKTMYVAGKSRVDKMGGHDFDDCCCGGTCSCGCGN